MFVDPGFYRRFRRTLFLVFAIWIAHGATAARGQAQGASPAFDVASVKQNKLSTDGRSHIYSSSTSGNFRTVNVSMKALLQAAYGLPETQIFGLPSGVGSAMFDIEAKVDSAFDEKMKSLNEEERRALKEQLLQALLADRFRLACHRETRELPVYALVVAKGGSKLVTSKGNGLTIGGYYGKLVAQGITVDGFARELAKRVGRVVVDKTGIAGRFDVTLQWTPDEGPAMLNGAPIPDPPPSIYTAIQEQLGLKLEPQKGPVEVLVVDHVEMPTEN
jgi:uncharacterized protein (TIGR03435 family)